MRTTVIGILQGLGEAASVDVRNIADLMADWKKAVPATHLPYFKLGTWSYTRVNADGKACGIYVDSEGKKRTGVSTDGTTATIDIDEVGVFGTEMLYALVRYHLAALPANATAAQRNAAYVKAQRDMDSYRKVLLPFRKYEYDTAGKLVLDDAIKGRRQAQAPDPEEAKYFKPDDKPPAPDDKPPAPDDGDGKKGSGVIVLAAIATAAMMFLG